MNDFDVATDGMGERRLTDTDIEGIIDGCPVDGAPSQLSAMMAAMRGLAETGPSVPISGALSEFIVEGANAVAPATAVTVSPVRRRSRPFAKRAAAALAIVPAKVFIGATMAAAAFSGAQAFGVVDVPLLPGPSPQIEAPAPVTTPAPETSLATSTSESTTPMASPDTSVPVATTIPMPTTSDDARGATPATLPEQAAVDGTPGCELGQDLSAKPSKNPSDDRSNRSDTAENASDPSVDPCRAGVDRTTDTTPATGTTPTPAPAPRPGESAGAPASVPAGNQDSPSDTRPVRPVEPPRTGAGHAPATTPVKESAPGRTPPGG